MSILNDDISYCVGKSSQYESINPETSTQALAEMFGLLAIFLNQRPDSEFVQRLRAAGIHQFLDTLEEQEEGSKIHTGLQELGAYLEDSLTADDNSLAEELAVDWTRLFRGLRPGYGPKPPYGFLHQKMRLSELEYLRKIASYYSRFGAEIEPTHSNRPDFLGLQLAFLSFLYQQSSQAYQQGCDQEAKKFENAAADFFVQELANWAIVFCSEAQAHAKTGFYHGFLEILQGQIQEMAAR